MPRRKPFTKKKANLKANQGAQIQGRDGPPSQTNPLTALPQSTTSFFTLIGSIGMLLVGLGNAHSIWWLYGLGVVSVVAPGVTFVVLSRKAEGKTLPLGKLTIAFFVIWYIVIIAGGLFGLYDTASDFLNLNPLRILPF